MTETTETTAGPQVVSAITEALGAVLQRDLGDLAPDTKLFETLGLDSTGVLDLLLRLEELLDAEFDTDELEMSHFATVQSLADFITTELGR
ncbi:acyl carrier protein [Streptomyces cinereoruber]|uniref:Acyl carrier protein n=1 Tax=Streptomyces cinereoruber TaxID=67260 RepID=A0AAV4KQ91_9ACTN|nr:MULTISPECIES: phosphopantetheine-binding protein [Streptomyces]AVH96792.1 acyl carrier protein [Streptomyces sp. WAC00288]KYG55415.1 acyl carrier protein [Streptomyces sp. WAC04657]MBB4161480.1 acyl carrier protein [Streptomyces cinereoruber]MBY8818551.1 acyl carrier protein [Streptomyces cinereoruber]NIH60776.1 acyl carrier protein [Streptomyces cinereoruber]